jgi:hypothetical protein
MMKRLVLAASLAGAVDTATFIASRRQALRANPGRGAGSLLGLGLWSGLAASAALERRPGRRTLAFASAVGLANGALLAAHLRRHVYSPRVLLGAGLAAAALGAATLGYGRGKAG